ncbi:MAG: PAS domain S-box protein [Deltaproteobacteria bacterium]|nr:PAS domain S-box protein [Deltaproteobacteria bacterium]
MSDSLCDTPSPLKILLVEDVTFDRALFREALKKSPVNIDITDCTGAEEALKILDSDPSSYNVIVIDHTLPGISGLELSRIIISKGLNIPIILLTGTGSEEIASEAIKIGINDYIIKGSDSHTKMLPFHINRVFQEDISRKCHLESQKELNYQRVLLEGIFSHTPDAMIVADKDNRIIMCNPASRTLFGYSDEEMIGEKVDFLYDENTRFAFKGKLYIRDSLNRSIPSVMMYRRKKGEVFLGETIASLIKGTYGEVIAYFSHIRDLSDREKVEETKKRQFQINNVLHSILQISFEPLSLSAVIDYTLKAVLSIPGLSFLKKGAIFLTDEDGKYLKLEAQLGLNEESLSSCGALRSGQCDCQWIQSKNISAHIGRTSLSEKVEYSNMDHEGHYCVPILSGNQAMGIINTTIEAGHEKRPEEEWLLNMVANTLAGIIERKRAEDKLRFLGKAIETTNMGVTISDLTGKIIYVNPAEAEMHGYRVNEILGQKTDIFAPAEIVKPLGLDQLPELSDRRRESINVRKDGSRFPVYLLSDVVNDEQGNPVGFVTTCEDITKRKKAEEELKDSYEQIRNLAKHLETAREEERKRVSRDIHDELGQMLTVISFDVAWLAGKINKKDQAARNKIKETMEHIDLLIEKVQAITSELRPAILDNLGLVAGMEWHAGRFEKSTDIKCIVNILNEIPELDEALSTEIFRIFQESLTNAARHSKATKVVVNMKKVNNRLSLIIRDNGEGIEEEKIKALSSVGIIGMRERIRPWGGKLDITGVRGVGTTVEIIIPTC